MKICIACSSGGHFREAQKATQLLTGEKYFVTFRAAHLSDTCDEQPIYFITHPKKSIVRLLKNAVESLKILWREKPDLIISTGADVAVATCLLGKLLGVKLIFIESGGQVYTPSLSGRIVYPFADLFIVQWKPALKRFPKAIYGGPLF